MKGGNTDELYKDEGRLKMAQSLYRQHPDIVKIIRRWGRYQHYVNYEPFKNNRLIKKGEIDILPETNEYGLRFVVDVDAP
jgi:exopolysaccharide biosynthesis predicted pyruvyltransferase EpsI